MQVYLALFTLKSYIRTILETHNVIIYITMNVGMIDCFHII